MIYLYANRIRKVLKEIRDTFWPSNIDDEIQRIIENRYIITLNGILIFISFTSIFIMGTAITPLILEGDKNLPYPTLYPFDWTVRPFYEILFVVQVTCDVLIPVLVFGYDFLFFSLCFILTAQYICLYHVIEKLGTKDMKTVMEKIGFNSEEIPENQDHVAQMFMEMFVKQHVILFK